MYISLTFMFKCLKSHCGAFKGYPYLISYLNMAIPSLYP